MSRTIPTKAARVRELLFPFTLALGSTESCEYVLARFVPGTVLPLAGMGLCALIFTGSVLIFPGKWLKSLRVAAVALTGVYGLMAMTIAKISN